MDVLAIHSWMNMILHATLAIKQFTEVEISIVLFGMLPTELSLTAYYCKEGELNINSENPGSQCAFNRSFMFQHIPHTSHTFHNG